MNRVGDEPADDGIKRNVPAHCKFVLLSKGGPKFKECLAQAWF